MERQFGWRKFNLLKLPVKPLYYILLTAGVVLRLIPYFLNRSLWSDEAAVALNITDRNFSSLLHPLDYQQAAPVLFLFIEKINILLFGNSEMSLRLFPLLCGLVSLSLVHHLTKSITNNEAVALLALFLIATSPLLINYSVEVKQYQSDLFAALCLLNLVFSPSLFSNENKRYIALAIIGSILIFLSNSVVAVLFTIGVYYLSKHGLGFILKHRLLILMFACWTIAFALYYFFFIYHNPVVTYMQTYWQAAFTPLNIFSMKFIMWVGAQFTCIFDFFALPFKIMFFLAIIIFIWQRRWKYLFLLLFPLGLHIVLSALHLYPFETRFMLYLAAFFAPMLALAFYILLQLIVNRTNKYVGLVVLIISLASMPRSIVNKRFPFRKEELRDCIGYINSNWLPGQKVYVYCRSVTSTYYYERIHKVSFDKDVVCGTRNADNPDNYLVEIDSLKGNVWLLFSHVEPDVKDNKGDEDYIINHLIVAHRQLLKSFKTTGSSAYLVSANN